MQEDVKMEDSKNKIDSMIYVGELGKDVKLVDANGNEVTPMLDDSERTVCEVWTRVMGYHRPVDSFNKGKKSEYYSRKCFTEEKAKKGLD